MANLLDLAQKMGVGTISNEVEKKISAPSKRRPWLEEENEVNIDHLKVKKGELKKPIEPLKKLDEKLEKIEIKTDRLIEKHKKQGLKSAQVKNKSKQVDTYQEQNIHIAKTKEASLIEFHCLKGLPKSIINHIKEKAGLDDQLQKWISIIDTEELKLITNKTASHLSVQMLRLEKQGWFQILKSNNAGVRVIEIDPSIYPIKQ
jgi:hypothetical protein